MTEPFGLYRLRTEVSELSAEIDRFDASGSPIPPRLERLLESKKLALQMLEKLNMKPWGTG